MFSVIPQHPKLPGFGWKWSLSLLTALGRGGSFFHFAARRAADRWTDLPPRATHLRSTLRLMQFPPHKMVWLEHNLGEGDGHIESLEFKTNLAELPENLTC